MILLLAILASADASRPCAARFEGVWTDDNYAARTVIRSETGTPACRMVDLGARIEWRPVDVKVVLRRWDDAKQVFGMERIFAHGDRWVVHIPELRSNETLTVDLDAERVSVADIWREPEVTAPRRSQVVDMEWRVDGEPTFGPDGTVSRVVKVESVRSATKGVHRHWWPQGVENAQCEAYVDEVKMNVDTTPFGCAVRVDGGDTLVWHLRWLDPAVSSSDEWLLESGDTIRLRGADFESHGINPKSETKGLQFEGPGRLSIRIDRIAGVTVDNNALEEIRYAAKAVSLPEPGVGIEFKGFRGDWTVIPVLLEKLRTQVVTGFLPGVHALKPRKLLAVRKSRWGTPWEQALILTRYLQQLKIPAEAYPVRPALMGTSVAGAPLGFSGAVVRVETKGGVVWLDPSCAVCGVGEISPSLWGGTLFDEQGTQLPSMPSGDVVIRRDGRILEVVLVGVQALDVRRWLTNFPVDQRPTQLAERFGGTNATLLSHDGLVELGKTITLRIETQSRR